MAQVIENRLSFDPNSLVLIAAIKATKAIPYNKKTYFDLKLFLCVNTSIPKRTMPNNPKYVCI